MLAVVQFDLPDFVVRVESNQTAECYIVDFGSVPVVAETHLSMVVG